MAKAATKAAKKAAPAPKAATKTATKAPKKAATKAAAPAPKKAAAKSASKAAPKKAAAKGSGRQPNAAFMAPLNVTAELSEVIGTKAAPRTEIIKKIWEYIRANGLQDQKNKRMINADAKLKPIFEGKKQISMFELAKVVNNHVVK